MILVEALAAGVVGAALLWLVVQPLILPIDQPIALLDPPDPEETPRGRALLALKEIEFDRATGKLSDTDFHELHERYTAAAVEALGQSSPLDATDQLEEMISARVAAKRTGAVGATGCVRCLVHGPRPEADAKFCGLCGAGLLTEEGACVACGVRVPGEGKFCPGCGVAVSY